MNPKVLGVIAGIALAVVMLWPSGSSQKVKTLYEEAEQLLSESKYEEAIAKYEEALEESTKWGVKTEVIDRDFGSLAKYKIAYCYAKMGEETGDLTQYEKSLEYIKEVYTKAFVPKHKEAVTFLWGHVLYKMERYEEAEPKFRELIANFPNSVRVENAWYSIGMLNYQLKNFEESRKAFRVIVNDYPNSKWRDDAQYRIAQSFLEEENWEMAYQEFDKITTDMFPNQPQLIPEARYKAAYSLNQLGRDDEALSRYSQFVTNYPGNRYITAAYFDMGAIYTRQKDYENALQNYQLAMESTDDPRLKAEIQYSIGENYFEQEDYENALASYQKVIENYPESPYVPQSKFRVGEAYMKMKDWQNAINAYQIVLNEYPGTEYIPYTTFQIAEAYYQLKDYDKSLEWYNKVVTDFPDEQGIVPYAMYGMLWSLSNLKRYEELDKLARQFIAERKNDEDFDLQAAEMQMKLGDIYFELAEEAAKTGDIDTAIARYRQALQEYPKTWTDYQELPKFNLIKCVSKFQEALGYYKISELNGFKDTDALRNATKAYEDLLTKFRRNFEMRFDFPERNQIVQNSLMNLGLSYEKLEEWDNARRIYGEIKPGSPNYTTAQLLIAESYITQGNVDEGIKQYQKIINDQNFDKNSKTLAEIKLADLLRHEGRYTEAIQQYERIVQNYPNSEYTDEAQYFIGLCYYSIEPRTKENLENAIANFQKLIDNYPQSGNLADAYFGIAQSRKDLGEMGDDTQWVKIIEICDYINNTFTDLSTERMQRIIANSNLLKVYAVEKAGSTDVGKDALIASLRKVVSSRTADDETKSRSQLKIGHILFEDGKYSEAIPEYQKVADMFPNTAAAPLALYQIAVSYYKLEQYDFAVQASQVALKQNLDPDMLVSVNYTLGLSLEKLMRNDEAIQAFEAVTAQEGKITKEDRKDIIYAAHTELAKLYNITQQYPRAIEEYQYVINNAKTDKVKAQALISAASIYENNVMDYPAAVDAYKQIAQLNVDPLFTASAYYRMGFIYANNLNDMQNASMMFDALIKNFADSQDTSIQEMVSDASVRLSDIYFKQGDLEGAIQEAERIAEMVLASPKSSLLQKVQSQYQVGYLNSQLAQKLYEEAGQQATTEYVDAARKSALAYAKIDELVTSVENAPADVVKFLRFALFQAGQTLYSLGFTADHEAARPILEKFIAYTDQGVFGDPNSDSDLMKELQTAMSFLGTIYFMLAQVNELDPVLFTKSANIFADMVRRWPNAEDAGLWQYQAGEAFFAMQNYQKAIDEYRKVVDNYPSHSSAAEALYAMAACYRLLADDTDDPTEKQNYTDMLYALNEELIAKYPTSKYAAEAYINVGNKYYNESIKYEGDVNKRIEAYTKSIEMYKKAIELPNIDPNIKMQAQGFLRDTEEAVAYDLYNIGLDAVDQAKSLKGEAQAKKAEEIIKFFNDLISKYPNTTSADIAYVQIGIAYELIEDWENAMKAYETLRMKYIDKQTGAEIVPDSDSVIKALEYAKQRHAAVFEYYTATKQQ